MLLQRIVCRALVTLLLASAPSLFGQAATGTVSGVITDMSGATVPDASLEFKNVATGISRGSVSDSQGRFRVAELAVGNYQLQASKTGFSTVVQTGIQVTVGSQAVIDVALPVGQQQQVVTVEGQVSQVETTTATVASLTDQRQMRELPLNGRNFEQLIQLSPGVQQITAFTSNSLSGRAPEYSIAGSRPTGQAILLDDENLQNFWNKGMGSITGSSLGVEAIGEFQTMTNTYSAQFGGNGGVINAVSKSGANAYHGSAFEFLRNSALDARRFIDPSKLPSFRRNQFGGSLGGAIRRDKLFFFANYEGIRQALGVTKLAFVPGCNALAGGCVPTTNDASAAQAIRNTLALFPLPDPNTVNPSTGIGTSTQVATQRATENYFLGRIDYNISEKDSLFVRYILDRADFSEPFAGGGFAGGQLPNWPELDNSRTQYATTEWRRIISPTLVSVSRFSFSRPYTIAKTIGTVPQLQVFFPGAGRQDGQVTITGLSGLGGATALPFNEIQNRYTEAEDFLWTRGAHSLRFGASISRLQTNTYMPFRQGSTWSFQSLTQFLGSVPGTVTWTPPLLPTGEPSYANRDFREIDFTPYIQDDWKVTSRLTFNLGFRWEFMTNPVELRNNLNTITDFRTSSSFTNVPNVMKSNPSDHNFAPRLGFAFDPFGDHKTSIRGGFGMFYDMVLPPKYAPAFWNQPPWGTFQAGTQVNRPNVSYPMIPVGVTASLPTSSPGWDWNNSTTPYMMQYNLNIQRQIAPSTALTVGYVGSRGVHLFSQVEQNPTGLVNGLTATCCNAAGRIVPNPRLNTGLGSFPNFVPMSSSNYNALQVSVNRRFAQGFQGQLSYTYSKCMDNGSDFGSFNSNTPATWSNPYNHNVDRGPCSFDITHVLSVNALYTLPFKGNVLIEGWQLSGIMRTTTGVPLTITSGADQTGMGGGAPARPNMNSGCSNNPVKGTIAEWYDRSCFSLQPAGTFGDLGRNTVRGPNFRNLDFALLKSTPIRAISETFNVQFRAEFFNILNRPNYAIPGTALFVAGLNGGGSLNSTAARITDVVGTPRQIQFALKLVF